MNRQAQAVVLLLFGGAILKASSGDLYLRYVKEGLRPFLLASGAILVTAAVMTLWYELRPAHRPAGDGDHHHEPKVGWLLLLPVLGLLLVAPPALGAYTADQSGTLAVTDSGSDYSPLPEGDPVPVGLLDYASRALYDDGRSLAGRRMQLTGFLATAPDGAPMLARIVVSCCAADGRPIKIGLTGGPAVDVPAGTWVQVTGTHSAQRGKDPVNQADIAYLLVEQWQPVPAPKQQYE